MIKTFDIPTNSIKDMFRVKDEMKKFLVDLRRNTLLNNYFSEEDVKESIKDLLRKQRLDLGRSCDFSWCLGLTNKGMPSDARVDFIYEPTYIAISILTCIKVYYPQIAEAIDGFDEALKDAMKFSLGRNLTGHGYESVDGTYYAIEVFDLGDVPRFLHDNPDYSTDLLELLKRIYRCFSSCLENGQTMNGWNKDYRKEYEFIADKLKVLSE